MSFRRVAFCAFCAVFLALALCNYHPVTVLAGEGFQPPNPEELKMTSEPLAPGAPAIILYRQVDRDDSGRGTFHEDNYIRIKILTDEGRKQADVEIPFVKDVEQVVRIRARTIKPDGSIIEFDGNVFEKPLLKAHSWRVMAKTFTLPGVEAGSIIEYSYTLDLERAFASHWIISEELFSKNARFSLKPFDAAANTLHSWQHLPSGATLKQGSDHVVRLEVNNVPPFQSEDYMPPQNELKSRVDFGYQMGVAENDPDKYWQQVDKRWNEALEKFIGKRKAMDEAVAQIISPSDSPDTKLRKIYDRVQHIRNVSYDLQKTSQEQKREKEKLNENVEDVWKREYGSRWQLDWLFLALVRSAGFEAYGCWVSSRAEYFFTPTTMESGHLNEPAVLVKMNGKDLYFNPGAEFTPFGMLNWSETGTQGMRLDKDGGTWIKTALPDSSESRVERRAQFKLSESGDLEGKVTVTFTGLEAIHQRLYQHHQDDVARRKFLESHIKNQVPGSAEVELTNTPDWTGSDTPLVAEFKLKVNGWASNAGKRVLIPAGVFTESEKHLFEHANRVYPIYCEYPYEELDDVAIELPAGWKTGSLPPQQDKPGNVVSYSLKVEDGKDALHLTRTLKINFLMLDQKYYSGLRSFFQMVRTGDEQQIVLQPEVASASN